MRRLWLVLVALPLPLAVFGQNQVGVEELLASVVKITSKAPEGQPQTGTGFIVHVDGELVYIATASHVVEGDAKPQVAFYHDKRRPVTAEIGALEAGNDKGLGYLIVRDRAVAGKVKALDWSSQDLKRGEDVMVIGFGRGLEWGVIKGSVASTFGSDINIDGNIEEGNSGGPIIVNGRVAGMVTSMIRQRLGIGKSGSIVRSTLLGWEVNVSAPSSAPVTAGSPAPAPSAPPEFSKVIYAVAPDNQLLWYRHEGRAEGTPVWVPPEARGGGTVGTGWDFRHVFSGGDGVIYAIKPDGQLFWYRHDGRDDGSPQWASEGRVVGVGWNVQHAFAGGGGVVYAVTSNGNLLWNRHDGREDGSFRWAAPEGREVGTGWGFKHLFSGGEGVIYAITSTNQLLWYRHDGRADGTAQWAAPEAKVVGTGWDVRHAFSGGGGVIYAIRPNGDLVWNRHDGRGDGSPRWAAPSGKNVGTGWIFKHVFSGARLL